MATAAAANANTGTETASISASRGFVALVASLAGAGAMHIASGSNPTPPRIDIGVATAAAESRAQQVVRDESAKLSSELSRDLAAHRADIGAQLRAMADTQAEQARALLEISKAVARIEGQLSRPRK